MAASDQLTAIQKIDIALRRYYKKLNKEYDHLFVNYCDENGLDDETVIEEFAQDAQDSILIEFDEDFPFRKPPKNVANAILDILQKCRNNPDISFEYMLRIPEFNQELFDASGLTNKKNFEEIKHLYKRQFREMYYQLMSDDFKYVIPILALGKKYKFDYLLHLVDDYTRDRIKHCESTSNWSEQMWFSHNHKHFQTLKNVVVTTASYPEMWLSDTNNVSVNKNYKIPYNELVLNAVSTFNKIMPQLLFAPLLKINDSLEVITKYMNESIAFVSSLTTSGKVVTPFQFDVCVAVGRPICGENNVSHDDSDDTYDDSDDDDYVSLERQKSIDYIDYIGNIKNKLMGNDLGFKLAKSDEINNSQLFSNIYNEFKTKYNLQQSNQFDYIHRKRLIVFIDRRRSKSNNVNDDIWMYDPPLNCRIIPNDAVPEWYINSSKTCLLPNMEYTNDMVMGEGVYYFIDYWSRIYNILFVKDIQNMVLKFVGNDEREKNDLNTESSLYQKEYAIGSSFHCKASLLTFSFHVKAIDIIKCYMYWNGQMIRFMPQDIKTVLPEIFNMKYEDNEEYINSKTLDIMIKQMNKTLVDKEFAAFQESYA